MKETKRTIAVIFGGCSPEYGVSLESAYAVIKNMDQEHYRPVPVGISRTGSWFYFTGSTEKIKADTWYNEEDCIPALLSPNRGAKRLLLVQGLIELADLPLIGCGVLASALCMDKDRAHKMVRAAGIQTPKGLVLEKTCLKKPESSKHLECLIEEIGYPLYVKPVKAGSSFGVTKVWESDKLKEAMAQAFAYDSQIIVEEHIEGFEVGCAVLGKEELIVGEIDEIELEKGFFDFTEKYTLQTSAIHVPARISHKKAEELKETAKQIYRVLGCSGFARVDMFLTPAGDIVFNEVNTIPGFTEHSRYPGMMKAAGYDFRELLEMLCRQAI